MRRTPGDMVSDADFRLARRALDWIAEELDAEEEEPRPRTPWHRAAGAAMLAGLLLWLLTLGALRHGW